MTDVPAYSLGIVCLWLGSIWLEGGRRSMLLVAVLVGLIGVSIREFALAPVIAVLAIGWLRSRAGDRSLLIVASGISAVGFVMILVASASIPGRGVPPTAGGLETAILLAPAFVTLSAVLLPALALAVARRMPLFTPKHIFLAAGITGLTFVQPWGRWTGGGGNLWTPIGLVGDGLLLGYRSEVFGPRAWALSEVLASFAALLLATLIVRWVQLRLPFNQSPEAIRKSLIGVASRPSGILVVFGLVYGLELIAFAFVYGTWDRYLYPMVPALAILLLKDRAPSSSVGRSLAFSHASLIWLALSAFVIAANSFAYDAARWREGDGAVAMGYDKQTVDAGYEWVGYHAVGPGAPEDGSRRHGWFEDLMWPNPACAIVSNSPWDDVDFKLVRVNRSAYLQYLFFGPEQSLYVYGASIPECPDPVVAVSPPSRPRTAGMPSTTVDTLPESIGSSIRGASTS